MMVSAMKLLNAVPQLWKSIFLKLSVGATEIETFQNNWR